jgi:SAM-dependent methyltransferase
MMTEVLDAVRDQYRATGLTERLKAALTALGPEDQRFTPQQLGGLDQFHTRGLAATAQFGELVGITADMSVLDIGSGVGGPARYLAATYGCQVTGVDLSEQFVDAARYLTERTGQSGQVSFQTASALELPFDDGCFNVVLLQHVAMNVADRPRRGAETVVSETRHRWPSDWLESASRTRVNNQRLTSLANGRFCYVWEEPRGSIAAGHGCMDATSRIRREAYVRFCERRRVRLPPPTRRLETGHGLGTAAPAA